MGRLRLILVLLACVYAASWFLPAVVGDEYNVEGYWAFWRALFNGAESGPFGSPAWVGEIWTRATAVSNAWFLVILALLLRTPQRIKMWMFGGVVCCVAINALWLIKIPEADHFDSIYLTSGYYLWLGSFVGLAVTTWLARKSDKAGGWVTHG